MSITFRQGHKAEWALEQALLRDGWKCRKSDRMQDIDQHFDLIAGKEQSYKIDVKAARRLGRSVKRKSTSKIRTFEIDQPVQYDWIYVEIARVRHPDEPIPKALPTDLHDGCVQLGSLYGKADLFAFELEHEWLLVSRLKLICLIKQRVHAQNPLTWTSKDEFATQIRYAYYSRFGRGDLMTLIQVADLDLCDPIHVQKMPCMRFRRAFVKAERWLRMRCPTDPTTLIQFCPLAEELTQNEWIWIRVQQTVADYCLLETRGDYLLIRSSDLKNYLLQKSADLFYLAHVDEMSALACSLSSGKLVQLGNGSAV